MLYSMLNVNETDTNHVTSKDKENSHHRIYFLMTLVITIDIP